MHAGAGEWADRYRFHLRVAAVAIGLALSPASAQAAALAALVPAALLVLLSRARTAIACSLLLLAGAAAGELRLRASDGRAQRLEPFTRIDERALLLERPRLSGRRATAAIRLLTGPAHGAKLLATIDGGWRGPHDPGVELEVQGLVREPARAEGSRFDWPAHLRRRGIAYELQLSKISATGARRGGVVGAVDAARRRAEGAIEAGLPSDKAALMRGMVLGQDQDIDALTIDDWRDSGLAHLLAVSGQNVMLLCALALPFLALAGASPPTRIGVLLALIALYVPLAGAGPSLQRAAAMGAAGLIAVAAARPASAAYGLLVAAVATLALNPRISGDPGWQLSFAAVIGILAARPLIRRGGLAGAFWLTAAATAATTPLLALHFEAVPLVSIPANLAALPAVAPVMWIGMLQAALGQLGAAGMPLAAALALVAEPLLAWLQWVAARAAGLPHAVAQVRLPGMAAVAGAYAVVAVFGWSVLKAARRVAPALEGLRAQARFLAPRTLVAAALAVGAAVLFLGGKVAAPVPPGALTISFLDVGQGDATLIQHPDGSSVLFDGGPTEARVARLLRQAGVRRLGAVVATHASADHHGGLDEVIRRFPVDLLLDGGDGTSDPTFRALLAQARERGIRLERARAGQTLRSGSLSIRILWPLPRPPGPAPEDPNPRAVVAIVSSGGFDLMLSADAESPTLAQLDLPEVEAMKVPHHGSGDPGLPAVLRELRPEVAVVPVGENSYGHPHPQTMQTLEALVPHVRRTDRDGTVRLRVAGGRMSLD